MKALTGVRESKWKGGSKAYTVRTSAELLPLHRYFCELFKFHYEILFLTGKSCRQDCDADFVFDRIVD